MKNIHVSVIALLVVCFSVISVLGYNYTSTLKKNTELINEIQFLKNELELNKTSYDMLYETHKKSELSLKGMYEEYSSLKDELKLAKAEYYSSVDRLWLHSYPEKDEVRVIGYNPEDNQVYGVYYRGSEIVTYDEVQYDSDGLAISQYAYEADGELKWHLVVINKDGLMSGTFQYNAEGKLFKSHVCGSLASIQYRLDYPVDMVTDEYYEPMLNYIKIMYM